MATSTVLPWTLAGVAGVIAAGVVGFMIGNNMAAGGPTVPAPAATAAPQTPEQQAAANQPPPGTTTEKLGDWTLVCQEPPGGKKACFAVQNVTSGGDLMLNVLAGYNPDGQKTLAARAPLGIQLSKGLEFQVGEQKAETFAFESCTQVSCDAIMSFDDANFDKLIKAGGMTLTYTRGDGSRISAKVSVAGLTDSYGKIEKPVAPPAPAAPAKPAPEAGTPPAKPAPAKPGSP